MATAWSCAIRAIREWRRLETGRRGCNFHFDIPLVPGSAPLPRIQYVPQAVEKQVVIIWTVTNGLADDIAVEDLKAFEAQLSDFIQNSHPSVYSTLRDKKNLDDDLKASLKEAIEDFKATRWGKETESEAAAAAA